MVPRQNQEATPIDRLSISHSRERPRQPASLHVVEHGTNKPLCKVQYLLLTHERHLQVKLRELGLAIGSQIFVSEAASYLIVSVEAGDHEHLLEELWALRQCIPVTRCKTGWYL
jgi:hypothetical protein